MKLDRDSARHVDMLARDIREAAREPHFALGKKGPFTEFDGLTAAEQEGYRTRARWLLSKYRVLCD